VADQQHTTVKALDGGSKGAQGLLQAGHTHTQVGR
jgi:hypothetical protein